MNFQGETGDFTVWCYESHPQIASLPHPMSAEPGGDDVAKGLAHLGVKAEHRTYDVAKLAAKIHPQMKLR